MDGRGRSLTEASIATKPRTFPRTRRRRRSAHSKEQGRTRQRKPAKHERTRIDVLAEEPSPDRNDQKRRTGPIRSRSRRLLCVARQRNTARLARRKIRRSHTASHVGPVTRRPELHRTSYSEATATRAQNATQARPGVSDALDQCRAQTKTRTKSHHRETPSARAPARRATAGARACLRMASSAHTKGAGNAAPSCDFSAASGRQSAGDPYRCGPSRLAVGRFRKSPWLVARREGKTPP